MLPNIRLENISVDDTTGSIISVDYGHHEIHEGDHYFYQDAFVLSSSYTQTYLLTVANADTIPHFTYQADGSGITSFGLYEGSDYTGYSAQTTFNNDRNSANVPSMVIHRGVTTAGTTAGTLIKTYSSGSASVQSRSPSPVRSDDELKLKKNTKYVFLVTSGTASNLCNVKFLWYEHTDK